MSDPLSPRAPRKGKIVNIRIKFLDDTVHVFQVPVKDIGRSLWEAAVHHLQLVESDYFGLQYEDSHGLKCWLDNEKPVLKQLPSPDSPLEFLVKFYTPDPGMLEEYTRYLYSLQIKKDLANGSMVCSENTAALIASYIVQAEIGDFIIEEYRDYTYLKVLGPFVPNQTEDMLKKVAEYHKQHIGESPAEAEAGLLDTARKVETYGMKLCPARDHENVTLSLAIAHMGILVFQQFTRINTFSWAKIRKLSFKRKRFLIKLHPETYVSGQKGYYKDTVEFFFDSRDCCKNFWKKCLEHHAFFRCHRIKPVPRNKTRLVSHGSSFRYSGRTQKQLMSYVRENPITPQFQRSVSGRISSSRSTSVTPKIASKTMIHNTPDTNNSLASSGSHVVQMERVVSPGRSDHNDTQSMDSSLSGSHSLHSPKLDHVQRSREGTPGAEEEVDQERENNALRDLPPPYPGYPHIQSSPEPLESYGAFGDRKFSAPVLGSNDMRGIDRQEDHHIVRSDEVENIPETVQEEPDLEDFPPPMIRSSSDLNRISPVPVETPIVYQEEDDYPPPPPPPLNESDLHLTSVNHRSVPPDSVISQTVIEDHGIHGNVSILSSSRTDDSEDDPKKKNKRHLVDRAYYIAKELLMTERTYKKDLEVITMWFQNAVHFEDGLPDYLTNLFVHYGPLYDFHCQFLKEVDQRLSMWEGKSNAHLNGDYQRIGDIMTSTFPKVLPLYRNYLQRQEEILLDLELALKSHKTFEAMYRDFEKQKVCYLPLNSFLLKPAQRILHYKLIMERLTKHYTLDHPDFADCKNALSQINAVVTEFSDSIRSQENLHKLIELQRDLVGIDTLVHRDRIFIREGCLQKFSRKGYQQRMFFLFSDFLVYTSRVASSVLQFKVHGQLPLRGMIVEESDHAKMAVANSFAIYGGNKCILVAASYQEEKDKWIEDLNAAIIQAKSRGDDKFRYPSLKSSTSSSDNVGVDGEVNGVSQDKNVQHRANTTMHVCWHRNTSVSMRDHERAIKNQLSGYLLRKFKNSNGWQKLWVVFTNFCLFFFKTYQDDFPLASLPLLGYAVNTPEDEDGIHKDHVFKLQFKNHVYFFRAESEYTFERWMEVINSATNSARRIRLFSRLDSNQPISS
ncbi:FERM, ARHGEF and pleckstrin domain-containing protein 1-like isoform X2 [Saccostrea echinata]|uniref:FERM, ARHGEF and pleckstrin domain-containing protein 1-like isoform X2 n=1 Tax=Saccostrea echinata TaxID=191078 RepID=UPI002A840451|nr:FERM, ARHGEF and pleckstrin domain-containing protein 1-like isoform X2 [Saccostrea echinata]XP_061180090.1 FERM, ARHGEF and pleckstrin domain-containing protein 1-like isoform X2 [Saccostrea echinata]